MSTLNRVDFINGKIRELETAILHCHSNCLLKFPTSLAKTLHTDEAGCVWISVTKPIQFIHEFDRSFRVELNYYKKGAPFYLNMLGIARLVIDPEEINHLPTPVITAIAGRDDLLVCIRIMEASYFENHRSTMTGFAARCKKTLSSWFYKQGNQKYILAKHNSLA